MVQVQMKGDLFNHIEVEGQDVWFAGTFMYHGQFYHKENIVNLFQKEDFTPEIIQSWNGEFALIWQKGTQTVAIVDRKRSIPLFYKQDATGDWMLTNHLSLQNQKHKLNSTAIYEWILTGYVANEKTLLTDTFQIEAGQYLRFYDQQLTKHTYFQYLHQVDPQMDEESGVEKLTEVFHRVFERIYQRLSGQTVMLPLSGGKDSRILALLLKEFDVKPIISFTYGKPQNAEALKSKEIADRLGFPWEFYAYSKSDWLKWYHSDSWNAYKDYAFNYTSIPHLQDWPAIYQMVQKHEEPLLFIPGHTGDFVSGGHIPVNLTIEQNYQVDDVVEQIMKKHHRLWEPSQKGVLDEVAEEIRRSLIQVPINDREQASSAYEYWGMKERQGKFILNSLRTYEFFGKEWAVPLWDHEIMDFFLSVPVELRFHKYLYDLTLHRMYPDYFEQPQKVIYQHVPKWKQGTVHKVLRKGYATKLIFEQYLKDPMDWFGITGSYTEYLKKTHFKYQGISFKLPFNINSMILRDLAVNDLHLSKI
ncbi:asparagine synthase C-terminal domain-containing protein [Hazenella coriacea]|uniref:asparagine synthase (glutamine-hydrolyzing) n=1 Tax=Hazenella coriacea TaxID=1179467 RepID=A0A4R3L302_9BACL|nr:asparagine synthase C-terminal domain-containing protein [Hazenella coriacea]TCS93258.1 asparagine synthase (glutamine-hydrolysing) [Hazenella coriacea]